MYWYSHKIDFNLTHSSYIVQLCWNHKIQQYNMYKMMHYNWIPVLSFYCCNEWSLEWKFTAILNVQGYKVNHPTKWQFDKVLNTIYGTDLQLEIVIYIYKTFIMIYFMDFLLSKWPRKYLSTNSLQYLSQGGVLICDDSWVCTKTLLFSISKDICLMYNETCTDTD